MKNIFFRFKFLLILGLLAGCRRDHNPTPLPDLTIKLTKVNRLQGHYEFVYAPDSRLTRIKEVSRYASGQEFITNRQLTYDSQGRLTKLTSTGEDITEHRYYYEGEKLAKLEEYLRDGLASYNLFTYDAKGRLASQVMAQKDGAGFELLWKYIYMYDAQDNLSLQTFYLRRNANWVFDRSSRYENYDSTPYVEHLTRYPLLPGIRLHRNNPGKLTVWTAADANEVVSTMVYQYNGKQYPVKKTTTSHHGTFDVEYFYQN